MEGGDAGTLHPAQIVLWQLRLRGLSRGWRVVPEEEHWHPGEETPLMALLSSPETWAAHGPSLGGNLGQRNLGGAAGGRHWGSPEDSTLRTQRNRS